MVDHRAATRSGIVICTCAPGNGGSSLVERDVFIPTRDDRDASCSASNRQLAIPPADVPANPRKTLAAARVAEPAHAARITASSSAIASSHRSPRRPCALSSDWRNPMPASHTAICTTRRPRRFCHCTSERPPSRHAPRARRCSGTLPRASSRSPSSRVGSRLSSFDEDRLRLRLDPADDFMHVLALGDGRDLEQHVGFSGRRAREARPRASRTPLPRSERMRARPVRGRLLGLGRVERRALRARLRERKQRREPVRRRPPRMPRVDEDLLVGRQRRELLAAPIRRSGRRATVER